MSDGRSWISLHNKVNVHSIAKMFETVILLTRSLTSLSLLVLRNQQASNLHP